MKEKLEKTLAALKTERDELRLQMHLMKADAKQEFEALEEKWNGLEHKLGNLKEGAKESAEDIGAATSQLAEELGDAYRRMKDALRSVAASRAIEGDDAIKNTWVVVADRSRARLFTRHADGSLDEFEDFVDPDQRLHASELSSDRAGRTFDSGGQGRHAMEPPTSGKDRQSALFAKRLSERIEAGRAAGEIAAIVLIAAPRFLGDLRASLSTPASALITLAIDKDLTKSPPAAIVGYIPKFLDRKS